MTRPISHLLEEKRVRDGVLDPVAGPACGVDQSTYTRWRKGTSIPRDDNWPALAAWLKITEKRVGDACQEQRRLRIKTKLRIVGRSLPDRRRTMPEIDQALRALETSVERQGKDMVEVKKVTNDLKKQVTAWLEAQRNQPGS